jgi:superfamily I DNA and/or RNA helicase
MRPAISAFPNHAFYKSALEDSTSVTERPPAPVSTYLDPSAPSIFISHSYPETTYRHSTRNVPEAEIIVQIVGDLLLRNPSLDPEEIGIISPYFAQTRLLQDMFMRGEAGRTLRPLLGWNRAAEVERVEVNTVDGFQGREKEIIILSTVRSNVRGSIGFLTDQRRLNVALTRAKDALFVVGDQRTLKRATMSEWMMADEKADGDVWRRYLGWMEEGGLVREWKEADVRREVQEGEVEEEEGERQQQYV